MSRSKRFVTGLLSSYAAIGVNILYTLASVPLALHYLNKEEFGLWALVTQLSGYLMLLEFGMSGSVARSLADHKDHMEDGIYGSILRTGGRVFAIQGLLVAVMGLALAWFAPPMLHLPAHLHSPFAVLMTAQAILSGLRLSLGALGSPLWCHQRLDLSNLSSSLSLVGSFAVLWIGFHLGWHVYSLTVSTIAGTFMGSFSGYLFCRRLGFYPPREHRGNYDQRIFRELFHFGGGLFLMNLGAQLASASQVIVVSRLLGIEAAATWTISTKIFSIAQQFVARVMDSSAGGLAEMLVRKETSRLHRCFRDLVAISAVMAVAASAGIALMNGPFIEIWTSGKVIWAPWNDFFLSCILFSTVVTRCHSGLVGISKEIGGMKYVYLLEGVAFVVMALLSVGFWGFTGLLVAALLCNVGITGAYGVTCSASYFKIPPLTVVGWIARPTLILILTAGLFSLSRITAISSLGAVLRLSWGAMVFTLCVIPMLWFLGIDSRLRSELAVLLSRFTGKARSILRMV